MRRGRGVRSGRNALLRALGGLGNASKRPQAARSGPKTVRTSKEAPRQKRTATIKLRQSPADRLIRLLGDDGLTPFETEYPFAKSLGRRWRFDLAWPDIRVAVEIEGGIFGKGGAEGNKPCDLCGQTQRGAHGSTTGILRDIEKYNAGVMMGWRIYRVPTNAINHETVQQIRRLIGRARGTDPRRPNRIVSQPRPGT